MEAELKFLAYERQKTTEILHGIMNSITSFLKFVMETEDDFAGKVLPTLDLDIWVNEANKIMYRFFEKPMASNMVLHACNAMPENTRISTLTQDTGDNKKDGKYF